MDFVTFNAEILNGTLHFLCNAGYWIYHGFKICQGFEYIRVLNMPGCIKKTLHHIDAWQGSNYFWGFAYSSVLNFPGLHKVI